MEPIQIIALVTFGVSALSRILQRKLVDRKKVKNIQRETKEMQKRMKELIKGGESRKKELDELQMQMLKKQNELMIPNMKVSMVSLPVFLILLFFLRSWFENVALISPIPVIQFVNWVPVALTTTPGYYEAYISYSLIFTAILMIVERIYDTVRHPEEMKAEKERKENEKREEAKMREEKEIDGNKIEGKESVVGKNEVKGNEVKGNEVKVNENI
ncbi:MAG: EMC3/TMCO1 family protein [Candidatus Diapherotrites archaeon]|nr:EMC3/TMCO1 family protein [Candidatus Diapherotrites archaeon]